MTKVNGFVFVFCVALLTALSASRSTMADEWDRATQLTFSEPVEVPGMVLTAGTYWFTLADDDSDRNIVQVWNADRTRLVTTILAVPDYRLQPTGRTVIHFEERPADQPEAIYCGFTPEPIIARSSCTRNERQEYWPSRPANRCFQCQMNTPPRRCS